MPTLSVKIPESTWKVETSHLVKTPEVFKAVMLDGLRKAVQAVADNAPTDDRPPFGQLTFRYEHGDFDRVNVVHAYFTNKHGKLQRFMRLRRIAE